MTMIDQGDGEEVVWGRFWNNEPQIQIRNLRKPHLTYAVVSCNFGPLFYFHGNKSAAFQVASSSE